jgi:hypothetical protein
MFMSWFNGEAVTIQRKAYAGVDKYNKDKWDDIEIPATALVAFKGSTRNVKAEGTDYVTQLNLVFPEGTDVRPSDTFIVRGQKWECDGWLIPQAGNLFANDFLPADIYVPIKRVEQ